MFMGEYNHTIDPKGRVIIPSKLRDELGDDFVICRGFDGCLYVYIMEEWQQLHGRLKSLPLSRKEARDMMRHFLSSATNGEIDKQGRVLIPANLREAVGIVKDVVLLGVGDRIEIWSKDRLDQEMENMDMEEIAERLSELGMDF